MAAAATDALGSSHPTVGRRLQAFEGAVGAKLFQRSAGSLLLTSEGAAILPLAEQMEEATLGIARRLAGQEGGLQGVLRVTASDWFGAWMLPPIVRTYTATHPLVRVELLTAARIYGLVHREADLAFRVVPSRRRISCNGASAPSASGSTPPRACHCPLPVAASGSP